MHYETIILQETRHEEITGLAIMLFATGMGVGLLYFGTADPITHFGLAREFMIAQDAAGMALFITVFHWGLHAWAIYAIVGLVIAYFSFCQDCPNLMSAPIEKAFGAHRWARGVGWLTDLLSIYAIAIGMSSQIERLMYGKVELSQGNFEKVHRWRRAR